MLIASAACVTAIAAPATVPDSGLYSTASDYGTFMQLFLNGGRQGNTRRLYQHLK